MNINLNKAELQLIDKALDAYEKEATSNSLMSSLLGAMLTPKDSLSLDKFLEQERQLQDKATQENRRRKHATIMLKAKLYQAEAVASEHEVGADEQNVTLASDNIY